MSKIIDLHIHTTVSDGFFTPKQIVDIAQKNGVSTIAISDHDTIDAYTNELLEYAKSKNIELIPAVEISTKTEKVGIHVLGYNYDLNNNEFKEFLYKTRNSRHIYLHDVSKKLEDLGYIINTAELDKIDSVTKAHIALDIVKNELNKDILMKNFGHIPEKGEFIEAIMNENCPAYVEKKTCSPREAAEMLRKAHGKVVLAHPVAYIHQDNLSEKDIVKIVNDMKPDGIEANYLFVETNKNIIDESKKWNEFAQKYNLFVTVGSDFHNKDRYHPEIGFFNMNYRLTDKTIDEILNNIRS